MTAIRQAGRVFRSCGRIACAWLLLAGAPALADRPLTIVGSTFLQPYLRAVTDRLVGEAVIEAPPALHGGTERGIAEFCRLLAADTPDVLAASRRMRSSEFEACKLHGVSEII